MLSFLFCYLCVFMRFKQTRVFFFSTICRIGHQWGVFLRVRTIIVKRIRAYPGHHSQRFQFNYPCLKSSKSIRKLQVCLYRLCMVWRIQDNLGGGLDSVRVGPSIQSSWLDVLIYTTALNCYGAVSDSSVNILFIFSQFNGILLLYC